MPDDPITPPTPASMLAKFNPWMLPVLYVMGGGALSIGGMSIAVEKEHSAQEAEECEACEECPDTPRRRDLQHQLEELRADRDELKAELEAELSQADAANGALLGQLAACVNDR